jgi:hypothetical protein
MAESDLLKEQFGAVTHVEQNGGYVIRGEGCPVVGLAHAADNAITLQCGDLCSYSAELGEQRNIRSRQQLLALRGKLKNS